MIDTVFSLLTFALLILSILNIAKIKKTIKNENDDISRFIINSDNSESFFFLFPIFLDEKEMRKYSDIVLKLIKIHNILILFLWIVPCILYPIADLLVKKL